MVVLLNLLCDHVLDELCFILSRLVVKIRRAVLTADLALDPQGVIEGIVTTVHVQPCVIIRSGVDVELLVHIELRFDIHGDFAAFVAVDFHVMVDGDIIPCQFVVFLQILTLLWAKK